MEQAQEMEKHIIWSNMDLALEDWKPDLEEDYPDRTDDEYYGLMHEINNSYFDDERANLDIQLSTPIVVCADLGLWNGRRTGYKMIGSGNIRDCLSGGGDFSEWFVDRQGDLRCTAVHHDGTDHYLYRAVRERVPEWRVERLQEKIYNGTADDADIARVTRRLGDEIAAVYGFPIPEEKMEKGGTEEVEMVDVQKEVLEEVELLGRTGYFTELRVDKETVPEGMYCYELRHGDDWGFPETVKENVRGNYFGAVLLAEALDLGERKAILLDCEDFLYTGVQMYLPKAEGREPVGQPAAERYETLLTGAKLVRSMGENSISFSMDEREAGLLCEYMDGHGYVIGQKDGQLFRGDLCAEPDGTAWEETAIDDIIDSVTEWNYEFLQEVRTGMENPDNFKDFVNQHSRYEDLCADEKVLDALFGRTKYGEQISRMAETLAGQLIRNLQSRGDIDGAVKELVQGIKVGQEEPDARQAKKQEGKAR